MKRVIVTGATGFVGANLAEKLINDGHEVHLLVRDEAQFWRVEHLLPHLQLFKASLLDRERLFSEVARIRPDWVFHLAAYGAYSWQDDPNMAIQTNFLGTVNLVDACQKIGFEVFVNTGSSSEYGLKDHASTERDSLDPNSYYAVTKASATLFCRYTAQRFDLPIYTLRLYSVFGPYEEPNRLIPTLIIKGLQGKYPPLVNPDIARDFIFSEDVIRAYLFMTTASLPPGEIYNVGTGKQTTLRDVVEVTREIFSLNAEAVWGSMKDRNWDAKTWVANNEKLSKAGWMPEFDFRTGYIKTVDWFKRYPALVQKIYVGPQKL